MATNATDYYASFTSDVSLGSAVLNFSVVLNLTYWGSPVSLQVELISNSTILDIVGLQSNGADQLNIDSVIDRETVFSIYYNRTPPETVTYPYDFNLEIDVLVIGQQSFDIICAHVNGRITLPGME